MEISEKLDIFYRAAMEVAREQGEAISEESRNICQKTLQEYEDERKKQQEARERVAQERVRKEVNREVSGILLEQKKEYHKAQEQKKEELFALVEEKLAAYRQTTDYEKLLAGKIARAVEFAAGEAVTVYLDPQDGHLLPQLLTEQGENALCTIEVGSEMFGGGIRARIPAKQVLLDESFGSRLREEREKFSFPIER